MLVSVIIPAYNREKTIKDAVLSVLNQTYQNLEVIVVDDCSKDKTVEIVKSMDDVRIRVIECKENGGACVARNIGIEHAKGEIIAFQDSDDIWHADKLEKSIDYMQRENADFVFSALNREEIKKGKTVKSILPSYNINQETNPLERIIYQNCVSTQTIVAKKYVFDNVQFDAKFPRFQDWDFAIHVIKKGYHVYYIDEPLVDCFVLGDSITSDGSKAIKAVHLLEKKYHDIYVQYPMQYREFCERNGYLVEMSGGNGAEYFKKANRLKRKVSTMLRYILAKIRLYRPLNNLVSRVL